MPGPEFGPVELSLVAFGGEPSPALLEALHDTLASGAVRLLDLVLVRREADGALVVREVEDAAAEGFPEADLPGSGLMSAEDVEVLAEALPAGTAAAVFLVEHVWARKLAGRLAEIGGFVAATERIPAAVVNDLLAVAKAE
ncbi:DUF6325 family protein [Amnibacterium kyonggiense]|uniref:DUF1269 domain-containing protein n=1 Tax=Amnibacterium kyonggiense TaxID=595671 RepID=A0A4R7FST8_9MICO|nr:DUF6325 family protein [Amnibacterium kyonggiense]TDS80942.1 hypothetical protein CLV52_1514 [Amnibacterium kyonggiense]